MLRLPGGERFMPAHDPRAELAPRDIVARAIQAEMERHGLDCVHLDVSHQPREFLLAHFPTIHARCLALGIDIASMPIPVAPAAHYTCGGVVADVAGRSGLAGLYVIGEAACTGLHGANRLASNSLLECVVTGRAAAQDILQHAARRGPQAGPAQTEALTMAARPSPDLARLRRELRERMSRDVGVVRSDAALHRAAAFVGPLRAGLDARLRGEGLSLELLELRNLALVAEADRARRERAPRKPRGAFQPRSAGGPRNRLGPVQQTPVSRCCGGPPAARRKREGDTPMCSRKKREKLPGVEKPRSSAAVRGCSQLTLSAPLLRPARRSRTPAAWC